MKLCNGVTYACFKEKLQLHTKKKLLPNTVFVLIRCFSLAVTTLFISKLYM